LSLLENQILDLHMIFEATADTITKISDIYKELCISSGEITKVHSIANGLHEKLRETALQRKKVGALLKKVQSLSNIVGPKS
jgi:hypothetical protein